MYTLLLNAQLYTRQTQTPLPASWPRETQQWATSTASWAIEHQTLFTVHACGGSGHDTNLEPPLKVPVHYRPPNDLSACVGNNINAISSFTLRDFGPAVLNIHEARLTPSNSGFAGLTLCSPCQTLSPHFGIINVAWRANDLIYTILLDAHAVVHTPHAS